MKGLIIRLVAGLALLLWAWDMVFPWQKMMQSEENRYAQIQQRKTLQVGMINHPIAYFIGSNGTSGIEYELAKSFADYLNVKLEVKTYDNSEQLFTALKEGEIDLAAAGLLYQPEKGEQFQIGASYYSASWQVAYKKGTQRPYKIEDLQAPLTIPKGSSVLPILQNLQKQYPNLRWEITDQFTEEELLLQVAEGKIPYTVAISLDISAAQHIKPDIAIGFDLTDEMPVVWYLPPSNYSELQAGILGFMNESNENGLISRLEEKYFNYLSKFDYVDIQSFLTAIDKTLPKYRPLFEKYKGDLDWQTLAAIAYQESHWDPNATSPTGVRGIMMLTKDTAERMNVSDRTNPAQSIKGGSEYLHLLISQLPDTIPKEDRIWFALAGYNMGFGHLVDVRRLTKQLGGDPDNWLDVKKNLPLLAEKRYYSNLKYGYARGFEAFSYVENIRRYLNSLQNYKRVEEEQKEQREQKEQEQKEQQEQKEAQSDQPEPKAEPPKTEATVPEPPKTEPAAEAEKTELPTNNNQNKETQ
nr:membrane-bound lytic murein transglycosylase MltF [Haemophilus paracuniculus]